MTDPILRLLISLLHDYGHNEHRADTLRRLVGQRVAELAEKES